MSIPLTGERAPSDRCRWGHRGDRCSSAEAFRISRCTGPRRHRGSPGKGIDTETGGEEKKVQNK